MLRHRSKPQTTFDTSTGILVRTSDEKPDAPELIDLKVTNYCLGNATGACRVPCYMQSSPYGKHADLDWIKEQLQTLPEMPFEIALGGGEPSDWFWVERFVEWCSGWGVVVNAAFGPSCNLGVVHRLTRTGMMKAVGISYHDKPNFQDTLCSARFGGARIVAHCVLSIDRIDEYIREREFFGQVTDGVTFLLFKPHGSGDGMWDLVPTQDQMKRLVEAYHDFPGVGFDSCCYPALKGVVPDYLLDDCDGGKYSLFVDAVERTCGQCSFLPSQVDLESPVVASKTPWEACFPPTLAQAWRSMERASGCRYQFGRSKCE